MEVKTNLNMSEGFLYWWYVNSSKIIENKECAMAKEYTRNSSEMQKIQLIFPVIIRIIK
jgi:hypothetical protein